IRRADRDGRFTRGSDAPWRAGDRSDRRRAIVSPYLGETKISVSLAAPTRRRLAKMNGLGNEIVILDLRGSNARVTPEQVRAIHRAKGLAFDQLMVLFDPRRSDTEAFMRIYNNDGSEADACGNGTRCVAYWL